MNEKNYWVKPREDGWEVAREGSDKASNVFKTKKEAEERGRELAKKSKGELIIQKKDGKIGQKDSYGNDPCPAKDKNN